MQQIDQERFLNGDLSELAKVASGIIPRPAGKDALKTPVDPAVLANKSRRLQTDSSKGTLANKISTLLKDDEILRAEQKLLIRLVDQAFDLLAMEKRVAREIADEILQLKVIWFRLLLKNPAMLTEPDHPAGQFIKLVVSSGFAWNNSLGRAGEPYLKALQEQVKWLNYSYLDDPGVFATASRALEKFIEQHDAKVRKLENRICDTAIGVIEANKNRFIVIRQINRLLGNKEYPVEIIRFIQGPWKDSMQFARSQSSKPDETSLEYAKLTGNLLWSISADALKDKQKFYKVIEDLKGKLKERLVSLTSEKAQDEALKPIKQLYLKLGQTSDIEIVQPQPIPEDELMPGVKARITPQILKKVQDIPIGQYFRLKAKDEKLRIIKLTLKSDDARMLVFTNFLGVKALESSYAEFAWLLSNNQAKAIQRADLYRLCWKKILSDTLESFSGRAAQQEPEAAAQKTIDQNNIEASRSKAIKEAEKHINTEVKKPKMPPQLNVGAWIKYHSDEETQTIKLAAHMAAMDSYVFVNREGKKILQCTHKQVEKLFIDEQMILLEQGDSFESFNKVLGKISSTVGKDDGE